MVHADIEIEHDEYRRLQAVGEIEGFRGEIERFRRIFGKQQHMLGVAMRGIGGAQQIALLRACRHAGRRASALHVEHHGGDFREIGEPDEFLHQRNAGAGGRREGARAVP